MNNEESEKLKQATAAVLYERRILARLTQEEMAERSGLARSYISSLENEKCSPTVEAIFGLAKAFNLKPKYLVGRIQKRFEEDN